ncbi:MAG: hypothetical protein K2P27_05625 [Lachnospiraceae bacterium]|nr:hypothetical protein [Lachnospiraceae bacterium]
MTDTQNQEAVDNAVREEAALDKKAPSDAEVKAAKQVISGKDITRMEAEVTPEARKVRRARAQAAYAKTAWMGNSSGSTLDVKAE